MADYAPIVKKILSENDLIDFALYRGHYKGNLRRRQDFFIKTTKDTRLDAVVDFRLKILLLSFW